MASLSPGQFFVGKYVEIKGPTSSTIRDATPHEIHTRSLKFLRIREMETDIADRQIALAALKATCDHLIFVDEPGHPYDIRSCACCGKSLGTV